MILKSFILMAIASAMIGVMQGKHVPGGKRQAAPSNEEGLIQDVAEFVGKQDAKDSAIDSMASSLKNIDHFVKRIWKLMEGKNEGVSDIRLVNGSNEFEGRVEVFHRGTWGSVCGYYFRNKEAQVVCRSLGYKGGVSTSDSVTYVGENKSPFGKFVGKIWLHRATCTGQEDSLEECQLHWFQPGGYGDSYSFGDWGCAHHEDVGVICEDPNPAPPTQTVANATVATGKSTAAAASNSSASAKAKLLF